MQPFLTACHHSGVTILDDSIVLKIAHIYYTSTDIVNYSKTKTIEHL